MFLNCFLLLSVVSVAIYQPAAQALQTSKQLVTHQVPQPKTLHFKTIHGDLIIDDPLVIELIEGPLMQRLKGITQYGVSEFVLPPKKYTYTRFDHSLGVYQILKKHGASRQEQIAGLLHDVSHTVFSHTTDFMFMGGMNKGGYQDTIHGRFLNAHEADKILTKYGFQVGDILPDRPEFQRLEQSSPRLCADRIEYIIHAGDLEGILTEADIVEIHQALRFSDGHWSFDNTQAAEKFARIALDQTIKTWGSPESVLIAKWIGQALKIMLSQGIITADDIHFNLSDDQLWRMLCQSQDEQIKQLVSKTRHVRNMVQLVDRSEKGSKDLETFYTKFRGVNPWVVVNGQLHLLTDVSPAYGKAFRETQERLKKGWLVKVNEE